MILMRTAIRIRSLAARKPLCAKGSRRPATYVASRNGLDLVDKTAPRSATTKELARTVVPSPMAPAVVRLSLPPLIFNGLA